MKKEEFALQPEQQRLEGGDPLHQQWSSLKPSTLLLFLSTSLVLISLRNENHSPVLAAYSI